VGEERKYASLSRERGYGRASDGKVGKEAEENYAGREILPEGAASRKP